MSHRTSQCLVQRLVECLEAILFRIDADHLAHTVEHNHGVIDLITDDCKHGSDKRLVDLHREGKEAPADGVEAYDEERCECHRTYGTHREGDVAETEKDVRNMQTTAIPNAHAASRFMSSATEGPTF